MLDREIEQFLLLQTSLNDEGLGLLTADLVEYGVERRLRPHHCCIDLEPKRARPFVNLFKEWLCERIGLVGQNRPPARRRQSLRDYLETFARKLRGRSRHAGDVS